MVLPGRDGVPSPSAAGGGTPALPDRPNPTTGRPSIIAINVSASHFGGSAWLRRRFITSFFNAAMRSAGSGSFADARNFTSAATSFSGKSRLRAIDLSALFRASYLPAVAASSPHTTATAADASMASWPDASAFRSTAFTPTSTTGTATGASGGGAGCWRLRKATTTATAAAISSTAPQTVTIFGLFIVYHTIPIISAPIVKHLQRILYRMF